MARLKVPVRGSILGHCYYDGTERDLSIGAREYVSGYCESDAFPYISESNLSVRNVYLRVVLPHYARVSEAYLDLSCHVAGFNGLRVAIAAMNGLEPEVVSQDRINDAWRTVRGTDSPLMASSGVIEVDGLNLKSILPEDIQGEIMALVLSFIVPPQGFKINKLNIMMGTEMLI